MLLHYPEASELSRRAAPLSWGGPSRGEPRCCLAAKPSPGELPLGFFLHFVQDFCPKKFFVLFENKVEEVGPQKMSLSFQTE